MRKKPQKPASQVLKEESTVDGLMRTVRENPYITEETLTVRVTKTATPVPGMKVENTIYTVIEFPDSPSPIPKERPETDHG